MATPAEIIAARVNGTYVADAYDEPVSAVSSKDSNVSEASRSLKDETAFPILGGMSKSGSSTTVASSASSWGPNSTGSTAVPVSSALPSKPISKVKNLSSTVQEAFSLDAEDQLNVDRTEFIKALTSIKNTTSTNIECTTSLHTKKRTFLITGNPQGVKHAKRLVIKKLTKPVSVSFNIPAKVRSRVIGAQGRTLKPIIQENEVRIDIGHVDESESPSGDDDEDDVFAQKVKVTIDGDAEGCKRAKAQILAIVKEETKNLSIRIVVDDDVKPFVTKAIEPVLAKFPELSVSVPPFDSSSKSVIIEGDRERALEARDEIKAALAVLGSKIVNVSVPIPQVKHQFLPIEKILEDHNVLIKLPQEGETAVNFVGEKKDIAAAQESAKKTTSQYKVEVLDMGKAHKGNLAHVKAVAAFLTKNGTFNKIAAEHDVKINSPSTAKLEDDTQSTVPIEIVVKNDDVENTKNAKKTIVSTVNKITPQQTKIVTDIDAFLINRVPKALDEVEGAQYVILNDKIVLFDVSEADEGEDFEDFQESSAAFEAADNALSSLRELSASLGTTVLQVPSAEQADIAGPHGTTLRSILSSYGHNSVTVALHSNGKSTSADEVYIHGLKQEVAQVAKDIHTVLAEAKEYKSTGGYRATAEVPTFIISRVIGKGGANLKNIKSEFGVKIEISDNGRDSENVTDKSLKSEVVITGIKRNAESAKHAIVSMSKKLADDTLVRVRIEAEYHRRIVGPSFSSINRLQDKYNVKIFFPSENDTNTHTDSPKSKNEVTIRGPSKGVAKAEEELNELYQFERENGHKSTLQIPTKAMARVIGRNGETIRDITDSTGVYYRFDRSREQEEKSGFTEIEITGSKSALKEATQKIKDIIEEAENFVTVTVKVPPKYYRDLVGPGGSVMRGIISRAGGDDLSSQQYSRLLRIPHEDSGSDEVVCQGDKNIVESVVEQIKAIVAEKEAAVTEEYDLAKEKHKLIIGPGGRIRHELQEEFGVQINIPRPGEASTIIQLVGLPEKIETLKTKLDEMTKDNWNESIDVPIAYHALVSERGAILKRLRGELSVDVTHGNLTRKATTLSNAPIPTPPPEALPEDGSPTKFTLSAISAADKEEKVIPWRFIGSAEATAKAAKIIQEQLDKAKTVTHAAWFYSANSSSDFPKIIGPQGARINKIRKSSGAFITVPRTNETNSSYIYLVGTEPCLKQAQEAIAKLL